MEEKLFKSIHEVLARSYFVFFLFILIGLLISFFWDISLFPEVKNDLGFTVLVLGTVLVFWAQQSSRKTKHKRGHSDLEISKEGFVKGPYKFYRSPTHLGVFLLCAGMAILDNSFIVALTSVIAFIFTRIVFIKREEKMLEEKYGEVYRHYKNKVKI
ncbi:MAG TPA: methyltransferase [Candidatus Paceibacterota bacterium]|nr:methyltransferase [Candidatus Paceibacterota bacterium]